MAISLPGISIHWAFDMMHHQQQKFHLFVPRDADMSKVMRLKLNGGLSKIFYRCQIKNESSICGSPSIKVLSVQGYD